MQNGRLYVVATPIGNLSDITKRALDVLNEVYIIAAEDTRHTQKLLNAYNIKKKLISCHEHNEEECYEKIREILIENKDVAYVTDAGTPCICDPGSRLVRRCLEEGFKCIPIPGPSSLTAFLSVAGFPADEFYFVGFLPEKPSRRQEKLERLKSIKCPIVLFEAPHRILDTLHDILKAFGNRKMTLAKELTKIYESIYHGSIENVIKTLSMENIQGEFILVVDGAPNESQQEITFDKNTLLNLINYLTSSDRLSLKDACRLLSSLTKIPVNQLYEMKVKSQVESSS